MANFGRIHRGDYIQRGRGIGSALAGLFSRLLPVISRTVSKVAPIVIRSGKAAVKSKMGQNLMKEAREQALKAGVNAVARALEGDSVTEGAKTDLASAKRKIANVIKQAPPGLAAAKGKGKVLKEEGGGDPASVGRGRKRRAAGRVTKNSKKKKIIIKLAKQRLI
jgi:hypothetical protein